MRRLLSTSRLGLLPLLVSALAGTTKTDYPERNGQFLARQRRRQEHEDREALYAHLPGSWVGREPSRQVKRAEARRTRKTARALAKIEVMKKKLPGGAAVVRMSIRG